MLEEKKSRKSIILIKLFNNKRVTTGRSKDFLVILSLKQLFMHVLNDIMQCNIIYDIKRIGNNSDVHHQENG